MQQLVSIFIIIVFLVVISRQVLYWSWLWQLKEYRADRLKAHFQDIGFKSAFLTMIGYYSFRKSKRPKITVKSFLIIILSLLASLAVLFLIFSNYPLNISDIESVENLLDKKILADNKALFIYLIVAYILMPLIALIFVSILNCISGIFKKVIISMARSKISKFPNLKIIGITGSYGKSTTKEILAELLSKKYKVLKTPVNINTPIGIARLVLGKLDSSYEIFIVEMGAYKIGEIKEICDMVHPKIGIITAINEQHLALFGSIENTIKAKFELFNSLPQDGLAVLNIGDQNVEIGLENENCISGDACKIKAKRVLYSVGAKADAYAINVANTYQDIKFTFISGTDMKDFTFNITGAHNVSNALAAIITAQELGMELDEISRAIQKISRLDFTLKILAGPNGSTLIDDTYNSNPDGVVAALDYIERQRGRKFVIMSSLIELGSASHKVHEKIGKRISSVAATLIFLDGNYLSDIKKGALKNKDSIVEIKMERNANKIYKILNDELKPSDTVIFINRGARKVLELLKK